MSMPNTLLFDLMLKRRSHGNICPMMY